MEITIKSIEGLREGAREFIRKMGANKVFAFYGKMGAGKTTFIKALCEEMGVTDAVNSPTFAIVNEYLDGERETIYHFDFYRIKRMEEVEDIGYDEYVYSGRLCLMEWPELIEPMLPSDTVRVTIEEQADGSRVISAALP